MCLTEQMQPIHQSHKYGDSGQATVELAIVMPFIVLLVAAFFQCAHIVANQLAIWNAARSAARAAAVSLDPQFSSQQAAEYSVKLRPLQITLTTLEDVISVHVKYIDRTDLPLIGSLFPNIILEATVAMPREIPTP